MASFQDLMRAAENAERAGDTNAARELVQMAASMRPQAPQMQYSDQFGPNEGPHIPSAEDSAFPPAPPRDNFGDTIEAATRNPRRATVAYAKGVVDQTQSPSLQNMPDWVPERYRPGAARIADTAMTGLSALGTAYAFGAGAVGETFGGSPTGERQLARDLMMMGEVAVPQLAGASGTVITGARAAGAADRLAMPPTLRQEAARAADDLGITPALASGGKVRGMTSATLEGMPIAGGQIAKDAARFTGEVETAFHRIVSNVGNVRGTVGAGESLQTSLGRFIESFKARSSQMYDDVGKAMPPGTLIQSPKTVATIQDAVAMFADKPALLKELGLNRWIGIADDLDDGLTWQAATNLRSRIGESIGKAGNSEMADMGQAQLKRIYATLTEDLEAAAIQAGPEAAQAWKRANTYYRRGAERVSNDLDKLVTADSPERAIEAFFGMMKGDTARANSSRLYRIKASMDARDWDDVSASILDRLGRAKPGQQGADGGDFSMANLLTEWNRLSPEAQSLLLKPEARKEMNSLLKVIEAAKAGQKERNASRTGQVVTGAASGAGFMYAPVTTSAILAGGWGASKAMTNPVVLRALNRAARGDLRDLERIAKSNTEFAEDARTILRITAAEVAAGDAAANDNVPVKAIGVQ